MRLYNIKLCNQDGAVIGVECARTVMPFGNENMLVDYCQAWVATRHGTLILQQYAIHANLVLVNNRDRGTSLVSFLGQYQSHSQRF